MAEITMSLSPRFCLNSQLNSRVIAALNCVEIWLKLRCHLALVSALIVG